MNVPIVPRHRRGLWRKQGADRASCRAAIFVNAGEKMPQRAGVKLHHGWMPNASTGGLLLRDKQDEKCIASAANVPERWSVANPACSVASIDPPAEPQLPF